VNYIFIFYFLIHKIYIGAKMPAYKLSKNALYAHWIAIAIVCVLLVICLPIVLVYGDNLASNVTVCVPIIAISSLVLGAAVASLIWSSRAVEDPNVTAEKDRFQKHMDEEEEKHVAEWKNDQRLEGLHSSVVNAKEADIRKQWRAAYKQSSKSKFA
jgi:hypothetical protein